MLDVHLPRLTTPWRIAQALSVAVALAVVVTLVVRPSLGLFLTWSVFIPLVPAVLLVAPQVWRNLCPVAVVHQLPLLVGRGGRRRLSVRMQRAAPVVAAVLFAAVVPLRLVVLDHHGAVLAGFVLGVLGLAMLGGVLVTGKGGWCATICPVLPVERLYGQRPIVGVPHAHCGACTGCIRSCYDLKPARSMDELVRGRGGRSGILRRPMGVFAAAFPGFVWGYFTVGAETAASGGGVAAVYASVLASAALGAAAVAAVQWVTRASNRTVTRGAAALAAGLYYWFVGPAIVAGAQEALALAVPEAAVWALRAAALALVATWLVRTREGAAPRPRPRQAATPVAMRLPVLPRS